MLVIDKTKWGESEASYGISVQDARYDHNYNTVWGRIKRAAKTLFGKPICFNEVYIKDEEVFKKLVGDLNGLLAYNFDEE